MDSQQLALIENEVARVVMRMFLHLDNGAFEPLSKLFAAKGTWLRMGKTLQGPAGVLEELKVRPVGRTTLHVITNLVVDAGSADAADATFYMTAFRHDGDAKPTGPVPMELPYSATMMTAKFVRESGSLRIQDLRGNTVFVR